VIGRPDLRRAFRDYDWLLLALVMALCAVGLLNLYSASYQTGLRSFYRQLVWFVLGAGACVGVSLVGTRTLYRYSLHAYVGTIVLLGMVLVVGTEVSGARSWISIGGHLSLQPSEFAKIGLIMALARFYRDRHEVRPLGFGDIVRPAVLVAVPVGLVLLQPDLGTALVMMLVAATVVLFMGVRPRLLLVLGVLGVGVAAAAWRFLLKGYQKARILAFLDPSRDPLGSGYNAIQSQIAIGSGKLFGKGLLQGSQTQLRFLPEQQTDFAFSVVGEEMGFVGSFLVLLLYFLIILWALDTGSKAKDRFTGVLCVGVAALFFWHLVINVGMATGLLPVTGVPLLLFSYGGSSFLTAMLGVGFVLGARRGGRTPVFAGGWM